MINFMQVNDADQLWPSVYERPRWIALLFCTCIKAINTANVFKRTKSFKCQKFYACVHLIKISRFLFESEKFLAK